MQECKPKAAPNRWLLCCVIVLSAVLNALAWCALANLIAGPQAFHHNIALFGLIALLAFVGVGATLGSAAGRSS